MSVYYTTEEKRELAEARGIRVDPEDEWLLYEYTWRIVNGYAVTHVVAEYGAEDTRRRIMTALHHCIMGQPIWEGEEIDHINHNTTDDRRYNLRYVTKSEQGINRRVDGLPGSRNIRMEGSKYRVVIKRNQVMYNLGLFDTLDEAAATRDEWLHQRGEPPMDEIAWKHAYNNLRVLIDSARETGDAMVVTHICNALLTITAMLDALDQRITEMQQVDEEEC